MAWGVGLRADVREVPLFPLVLYGASCLATFLVLLGCALLPRRGQVLPAAGSAARASLGMVVALVALNLAVAFTVPDAASQDSVYHLLANGIPCLAYATGVASVPTMLSLWSLRRVLPVSGWLLLAPIGGAVGALAGLVLHLHCPIQDRGHVVVIHGLVLVLPTLVLAAAVAARLAWRWRRIGI